MASTKKARKGAIVAGPDFGRRNYMILGAGMLMIVIGFVLLAIGDITVSPVLLVVAYCVIIPLGILIPKDKSGAQHLDGEKESVVSG